jgi:UDP-N-acetylglucosamine 4,6-dehydratase
MEDLFENKVVLITGGTGFLGRSITKRLLETGVRNIRLFSRDEVKHHHSQERFNNDKRIRNFVGDIRDYPRLLKATKGADIVIHAAALKRIDMIEYNVEEAIHTNIMGSLNIVRACLENSVKKVVFISTDKACSPVNTYGACKFVSERIFSESNYSKGDAETIFTVVRYGNVLESTGSVIPFFTDKIKREGKIPLTDPTMTRFIISSDQAVNLVFNAIKYGKGGEIFVPKLPSMKISDLIEVLMERIGKQCSVEVVGIRPGEKIHELMINQAEVPRTYSFRNLFIINPSIINPWIDKEENDLIKSEDIKPINMIEYNSKDSVISKEELKGILKETLNGSDEYNRN